VLSRHPIRLKGFASSEFFAFGCSQVSPRSVIAAPDPP
jgi:hypothetical protein